MTPTGLSLLVAQAKFTRALSYWNWKCALLSVAARSLVYLAAMSRTGLRGGLSIVLVDMAYVTLTAGLYAGLQQKALGLSSRPLSNLTVALGVPGLAQFLDWLAHRAAGAVAPARATLAVCVFTAVSSPLPPARHAPWRLPDRQARPLARRGLSANTAPHSQLRTQARSVSFCYGRSPRTHGRVANSTVVIYSSRSSSPSAPGYSESMFRLLRASSILCTLIPFAAIAAAQATGTPWTFAVSGDSRNCGDFVMPAIAAKVKAEKDVFYWHLGDFRAIFAVDQDMQALQPAGNQLSKSDYQHRAWDDFIEHQMASFGSLPVFLGRGNHETINPMPREGYLAKFSSFLSRPEIEAQRKADGTAAATVEPWYHWTQNGVDFITLDNASSDEFSSAQLRWLRSVLDRDLSPGSGIRAIVAGMHEALPHSTSSNHAMDDWDLGLRTGELVYNWFYDSQAAGKHVYLIASHSHYYSPNIYNTPYWKQHTANVVPGWIIGTAGAHRYKLSNEADKGSLTDIYGYMQGTVQSDGSIDFALHQISEDDLVRSKWPNARLDAIHECYIHNSDSSAEAK